MEPWDGPASIVFTDGNYIGAVLDRNGLRPSRYYLTQDDRVIMASEVGVLPIEPENVAAKGRLEPGKMFLIDFHQGRLIPDEELKHEFANRRPYAAWLRKNRIRLSDLDVPHDVPGLEADTLLAAHADVRLHDRNAALHADPAGPAAARSRWARWATTRRWPA